MIEQKMSRMSVLENEAPGGGAGGGPASPKAAAPPDSPRARKPKALSLAIPGAGGRPAGSVAIGRPSQAGGSTIGVSQAGSQMGMPDASMAMMVMSIEEFDEFTQDQPVMKRTWLRLQFRTRALVNQTLFNHFFLLAILGNTLLLAMEYDGGCEGQLHCDQVLVCQYVNTAARYLGFGGVHPSCTERAASTACIVLYLV